jgi:hypothetical protein
MGVGISIVSTDCAHYCLCFVFMVVSNINTDIGIHIDVVAVTLAVRLLSHLKLY